MDVDRREYNRLMDLEFERIRDFLILHYHATQRDDTPFWNHVRTMEIPNSLAEKIELFKTGGRIAKYDFGLFLEPSWLAVYMGQNYLPEGYDPRVDHVPEPNVLRHLLGLKQLMANTAEQMQDHQAYLRDHNMMQQG